MIFRCEMSATLEAIKFEINCFYNCAPCVWTVLSRINATHGLQRHCSAVFTAWWRDVFGMLRTLLGFSMLRSMWWIHCYMSALASSQSSPSFKIIDARHFFYGFCRSSWLKWSVKYSVVGIVNCNMWSILIYLIFFYFCFVLQHWQAS